MSYIDTSVIIAALDPADNRSRTALDILERRDYKIISELTLIELASVLSRRRSLLSELGSKLGLNENLMFLAVLIYLMRRFNLKYKDIKVKDKTLVLGKMYKPIAESIELSLRLRLKTLDLMHIAYIRSLKDEGESIHELVTADIEFRKAEDYLKKDLGIYLSILR